MTHDSGTITITALESLQPCDEGLLAFSECFPDGVALGEVPAIIRAGAPMQIRPYLGWWFAHFPLPPGTNLSNVDLSGAHLFDANLTGATFVGANLRGVDLSGADLSHANLTGATFVGANLRGAILTGANLQGANLNRADLTRADLTDAILTRAILTRANLLRARINEANLSSDKDHLDP